MLSLRYEYVSFKSGLPMQNYTQDDFQPRESTILFIKQFARMCNRKSTLGTTIPATCLN